MSWFKIDDGWWSHPKTLALTNDAVSLWTRSGSWSCQHLTDGFIPDAAMKVLGGTTKVANELVKVGYWDRVDGGWLFHDWADYQERSEVVKKRRDDARERMRTVRTNKTRTKTEPNEKFADGSQEVRSTPTRPDPTRPITNVSEIRSGVLTGEIAPPGRCPQHENTTNPPNCGKCKDARTARALWVEAHSKPSVPLIEAEPVCPHDRPLSVVCDICKVEAVAS